MHKALLLGAALGLGPVAAFAADLAPAPLPAPAPVMVPFSPWAGFYGGISFGWNWGDGTTVTIPQAAAGQPGFVGDTFRGPAFLAAQDRLAVQTTACTTAPFTNCTATDTAFALPDVGFLGRETEKGGAVFTLNAGYNWQFGSFVLGVEGDFSAMNRRHESGFVSPTGTADYRFDYASVVIPPVLDPIDPTIVLIPGTTLPQSQINGLYTVNSDFATRSRMNWLTTARLRAGYAAGDFLIYATGGLAAGRNSMSASGSVTETFTERTRTADIATPTTLPPAPGTLTYSANSTTTWRGSTGSDTEFGWTVGGGFEWMINRGFSLKAEYLYYDLGDQTLIATGTTTTTAGVPGQTTTTTTAASPIRIRQNLDGHIFRVGMNFGFPVPPRPAAPVVAAY